MPPNPYQQNKVRGSASAVARVFFLRELKAKDAKRRAQVGTARELGSPTRHCAASPIASPSQ
jgi:hypothetical protein